MDAETARRVTNPFYTTRTTRKVGLGLPFLIQNAEQTGGSVTLTSEPGKGTEVRAVFHSDHIDCPPWGDLPGTVALFITNRTILFSRPDIFFYHLLNKQHHLRIAQWDAVQNLFYFIRAD